MAGIFKRVEKKYLLTEAQCAELLARIEEHIQPDRAVAPAGTAQAQDIGTADAGALI